MSEQTQPPSSCPVDFTRCPRFHTTVLSADEIRWIVSEEFAKKTEHLAEDLAERLKPTLTDAVAEGLNTRIKIAAGAWLLKNVFRILAGAVVAVLAYLHHKEIFHIF